MAVTQTSVRPPTKPPVPGKNSRRNEIVAIALFALAALFVLCLVSYHPNDSSWNAGGESGVRNLVGSIGASVAAALLQAVGLAAYLLPVLLLAAAWRRFRTRKIHAPLSRVIGLMMLVLSASALLALSNFNPLFDSSVQPGGLVGRVIAHVLAMGLNTIGAGVLLVAVAAAGLLLATNFSFVRAYDQLAALFDGRLAAWPTISQKYQAWRQKRVEAAELRTKARRTAQAERVAEFMRSMEPANSGERAQKAIVPGGSEENKNHILEQSSARSVAPEPFSTSLASPLPAASARSIEPRAERSSHNNNGAARATERDVEIAAMVESASVVRVEATDQRPGEPADARAAKAEAKQRRAAAAVLEMGDYKMPVMNFLNAPPDRANEQDDAELLGLATRLAEKCKEFNVTGQIKHICPGPVVTTFEFKPDPGVKYSRVVNLVDDLCLALKAESIRIDRLPGKSHVGIEVPNPVRETIFLREVLESRQFQESPSKLTIALGKTIDGLNYVADLAKMPHLLIAGSTGAGKSVCVNSLVISVLYKARPTEVKFIMVDPKRLELGLYADIPHLATPIITDPKRASHALKWAVTEMERRYKDLAGWGVRNIDGYNAEITRRNLTGDFDEAGEPWKPLPYIVIIIDELADLMMVSGHEVEEAITRLAQMARAVGIHLVLATQRPSVDVITGLIKANFPSRISFRVSSKVDSRTIIDANGAEQLLGRGDMLFLPPGTSRLVRVHGAFIDEMEVSQIVAHIKAQTAPTYDETITQSEDEAAGGDGMGGERDELFDDALRICVEMKRASTSVLQRRLRIGYGRAAAILDVMERENFIGQADGSRPRPVLGRAYETVAHWDDLSQLPE